MNITPHISEKDFWNRAGFDAQGNLLPGYVFDGERNGVALTREVKRLPWWIGHVTYFVGLVILVIVAGVAH